MKMHSRLNRLEEKFISEPTILVMADGHVEIIEGPKDHLLTLFSVAVGGRSATPKQAADLALIKECKFGSEPGGARIVELIQCFQHGPAKEAAEIAG
jgi:sulfur relay (sulfurtransferase) DsrC/TusE family protein